ncbi:uncharacterized protein TRIREDRAFT_73706 [Trichoderma reesei QM6a]|uniref:Predicted protein n=2 Tax=Hypocrea jecorina TaxID=51453 RepID=G0R742_HYPJQ|nr:uncharacterized protein TRIREDRAFT_73706 [Trichoderma reesei QM6a]EGR52717.1 predicted protein [Trichoderma reesei QM6a]ETS06355.1 hypothetical protein M419DRAFT_93946 [Trichoderma reesei RUT C-30]
MSADTTPISPARFASAIKDLSLSMLHLKVLEIRNSIAHLQYSNDQLAPFAQGTSVALGTTTTNTTETSSSSNNNNTSSANTVPDQDCIDAIKENEAVIDRMAERIAIIRAEVEERGFSWTEFQSQDEVVNGQAAAAAAAQAGDSSRSNTAQGAEGEEGEPRHSAWTDGTFQTGTISNGQVRFDSQTVGQQGNTPPTATNRDGAQSSTTTTTTTETRGQDESGDGAAEDAGLHL